MNHHLLSLCFLSFMVFYTAGATAEANQPVETNVVGFWGSQMSIFEVSLEGNQLRGEVRALKNPFYLPEEDNGRAGETRTDDNNPDENLRSQPLIGLSMFSEYRFEDGKWQGKIYDPESGNTYQSNMKLNRKGELEIRGYIGMPMFGRTAKFVSIERCAEEMVDMLVQISMESVCAAQQ